MKSISYCLPVLFALLPACSGAPEASEPTEQDDAELRALKTTEILGDLSYGQTSSAVAYTETPLYRAYRFHGTAGDNVDAWIRSSDGDARAWLLRETFSTVTSNDNADSSTHDAHLTAKLVKTGTYYIAFREKNREGASITVTLNGTTPTEAGIWDASHCDGAPLTQADLTHYFEPAGTFSDEVANVQVSTRRRVCNDVTGCNAWQEGAGALSWSSNNTVISSGRFNAQVLAGATVNLRFAGNGIDGVAPFSCALTGACYLPPGSLTNDSGIGTDSFTAKLTHSCIYIKLTGSRATGGPSERAESEAVFYGRLTKAKH